MQVYVIAGVLRSGTELLCRMLSDAGIGYPREFFNGSLGYLNSYADYIDRIRENQPGDIVGIKVLATQFNELVQNGPETWRTVAPDTILDTLLEHLQSGQVQYILMDRRDRVAQAVSAIRAEETGIWHHTNGQWQEAALRYDPDRIETYIQSLEWSAIYWRTYFHQRGIKPYMIWYEDFTRNTDAILRTVREVAIYLDHSLNGRKPSIPFEKSAKKEARAIIRRYKDEHGYI